MIASIMRSPASSCFFQAYISKSSGLLVIGIPLLSLKNVLAGRRPERIHDGRRRVRRARALCEPALPLRPPRAAVARRLHRPGVGIEIGLAVGARGELVAAIGA